MAHRDIIVAGASAGGVQALSTLVAGFPADLPASVFVVLHLPETGTSVLSNILTRAGPLVARAPHHGERSVPGRIYVAPPNFHLLLRQGNVELRNGPRENGHRPAIDPLFRSAAGIYGDRVIGVILSGTLDDGVAGLLTIKRQGGLAVVQTPEDALFPWMPENALATVPVDYSVPVGEMGRLLAEISREQVPGPGL